MPAAAADRMWPAGRAGNVDDSCGRSAADRAPLVRRTGRDDEGDDEGVRGGSSNPARRRETRTTPVDTLVRDGITFQTVARASFFGHELCVRHSRRRHGERMWFTMHTAFSRSSTVERLIDWFPATFRRLEEILMPLEFLLTSSAVVC